MTFDDRIDDFKSDLRNGTLSAEELFQKHLIDVESYYFNEVLKNKNLEYKIKFQISKAFEVNLHDILLVGSGKIGFSLKPKSVFQKFDSVYKASTFLKDKSDLDVAIVSPQLFDHLGIKLYNFTNGLRTKWKSNKYYPEKEEDFIEIPIAYKCFEYYTKGWIRPDFVPLGFELCTNQQLEKLKYDLNSKLDNRKITFGFYKNWYFFKNYHIENIESIRRKIKNVVI